MNQPNKKEIREFLKQSNAIEGVYDEDSLKQAEYAWEYLMEQKKMSPRVILKTHKILMLQQPLQPDEKGYYRTCKVWIGGREAINSRSIPKAMIDWCDDMNLHRRTGDGAVRDFNNISRELHVDYERVHPFVDGNGRTGRMFMNWWRIKNNLPILIINEGKEQLSYYKWFK